MDLNEIQSLIKFVAKSGVTEVELETTDFKIVIKTSDKKRNGEVETYVQQLPVAAPVQVSAVPQPVSAAPVPATEKAEDDSKLVTIKSPMIGTFYRRANPESDIFVNVGDEITPGKVVCIIEAMKLFNEIESEVKGKIVKVLAEDASPVEYDQPLFLVEPA